MNLLFLLVLYIFLLDFRAKDACQALNPTNSFPNKDIRVAFSSTQSVILLYR
jgi:hypothetical protein